MLLLFALSVSAQGTGPFYGAGTSAPYVGPRPVAFPAAPYVPAVQSPYVPVQSPYQYASVAQYTPPYVPQPEPAAPKGPSRFDLRQANLQVEASERNLQGNNLFYNSNWNTLFPIADPLADIDGFIRNIELTSGFKRFGSIAKAAANQGWEIKAENAIDEFRRTHPQMTRDDRDQLDLLRAARDSAHNQKLRRFSTALSVAPTVGGLPVAGIFEHKARQADVESADINLDLARSNFRKDPGQDTRVAFRTAQDGLEEAEQRQSGTTFDILAAKSPSLGVFGPVLRKKASQTKLEAGYRNQRAARQALAKDPSEENRLNLQLANLFIRATEEEDQANRADIVLGSMLGFSSKNLITSEIISGQSFQGEANYWLKYDRLKRKILRMKLAKSQQAPDANPVAERMLGLSMYGPGVATRNY